METILKTKRKIRFQDCDPFNHLNNSRYIDYFLNAREDQLAEHYNLYVFEYLQTSGKSWIVTSNQISYIKPAITMETILMESQLIQYSDRTLLVEMKMWNKNETELKAILWTKFIQFSINTKKTSNHSEELMKLFQSIVMPIKQTSFEERCTNIIQKLKTKKK